MKRNRYITTVLSYTYIERCLQFGSINLQINQSINVKPKIINSYEIFVSGVDSG